ncbi:MAG: hypothetical protein DHS20C16_30330 [Phycisphaerae bacterium]|nr:MAG: hypothetical protein DHS20C16_30330 [Phycisphaerae bacterium]
MKSNHCCQLALAFCLAFAVADARAQCGDPDPSNVILNDADIWHITGGDLLTVLANPFPDDSQVGNFIAVRNIIDQPINYFRIISNEHFAQNNTSVFTVAEDLENEGGSNWWLFFESSTFDIVGSIECEDCESDDDCDDGDECTVDECNLDDEFCVYSPLDCDDDNACTDDVCDDGECVNYVISCDDGDACTTDSCDASTGCDNEPIDCDDGDACTADSCSAGVCFSDPICGVADGCCDESCDPGSDPDCFVCGERKDPCSSNSDCCSNKCRRGRCR